ncbi:MAG: LysR substrate-binding domain-containing protein [Pseudomonadota bacterium]
MRYVQLRAFHYVAITGGFSRAAEVLHLTQPAISDQVRNLEIEYDVRLFNREKKQITLSESGKKLFEITRRMFEVENEALALLSESQTIKSGRLSIGADSTFHITDILAQFRKEYPDIFISVSGGNTETVIESLNNYEADVGVGVLSEIPNERDYDVVNLGTTPITAFTSIESEFSNLKSVRMKELAKLPLVMREQKSKTRAKFQELADKLGIEVSIQIEAEGREAVREIVASSGGIGIVSEAEFGRDPRFVKIPITDAELVMDEAIICLSKRKESRLIRAFMQVANNFVAG